MAEKQGNTDKLKYDFSTSGVCEVCIKNNWYQTTAREFRSFDGPRRITEPIKQPGVGDRFADIKFHTYSYNGPVYVIQTNLEVVRMNTQTIVTNPYIETVAKSLPISNRI